MLYLFSNPVIFQSISPGAVDTEFAEANNLYIDEDYKRVYGALPKLASEDVADAALYTLSTPPEVHVRCLLTLQVLRNLLIMSFAD